MERIGYHVEISAPARTVWDTMLQADTYKEWTDKSWPGSSFEGKWAHGEKIRFVGPDGSGTLAEIERFEPHSNLFMRHIAALAQGGEEDRSSEIAKGWIGTTEEYKLVERDGKTSVTVVIESTPEWIKMFNEGWPTALQELKKVTERHPADV